MEGWLPNEWKRILKTGNGLGDVFIERSCSENLTRVILIENHGLHIEIQTFKGDYSGPIPYKKTEEFLAQCRKDGTL